MKLISQQLEWIPYLLPCSCGIFLSPLCHPLALFFSSLFITVWCYGLWTFLLFIDLVMLLKCKFYGDWILFISLTVINVFFKIVLSHHRLIIICWMNEGNTWIMFQKAKVARMAKDDACWYIISRFVNPYIWKYCLWGSKTCIDVKKRISSPIKG